MDLRTRLSAVRCPVRLLHGTADRIIPMQCARYLATHLPSVGLQLVEGCGHALPFTRPRAVAECIVQAAAEARATGASA